MSLTEPHSDQIRSLRCECVTARKTHTCIICNTAIERGERHYVQVYRNPDILAPARRRVRQIRYHIKCPQMELI